MKAKKSEEMARRGERELSNLCPLGEKFGPVEDRFEYEKGIESLPREQQDLVKELTHFADLCKYFEQRAETLDRSWADAMHQAAALPLEQRITRIRQINQKLTEGITNARQDPEFRH